MDNPNGDKVETFVGGNCGISDNVTDIRFTRTGYYMRKFLDPSVNHQYDKQPYPWRQIRYAEVLLNYAEACIELGEDAEARKYINMIRTERECLTYQILKWEMS